MRSMIIVYSGREGSSAIVSSLGKHSQVSVPIFEDMDYRNIKSRFGVEGTNSIHIGLGNLLRGVELNDNVFKVMDTRDSSANVVFKWRPCGDLDKVCEVLVALETIIISLARRDLVNFCISKYFTNVVLGDGAAVYHPQFDVMKMSERRREERLNELRGRAFNIDVDRFVELMQDTVESKVLLQSKAEYMEKKGVSVKYVFYEDFLNDKRAFLTTLLSEIGLEFEGVVTKSNFVKVNRSDMREQVLNLEDLERDERVQRYVKEYGALFAESY